MCGWGTPLFSMMAWMVLISSLYSFLCRWYVFSLLCRYLIAAFLCWAGWLEEYRIIVSVRVGFLYIDVTQFALFFVFCSITLFS